MCFLELCNAGQAFCNLIYIIQKSVFFEGQCSHIQTLITHIPLSQSPILEALPLEPIGHAGQ